MPTEEELDKVPKSLVVKSGHVGRTVTALVADVRQVMEPNTASKLRERKNQKVKDYVSVSSQLGVTHLLLFSQTDTGTNLRIGRIPRGPTAYFRVNQYSLIKDCLRIQKTPHHSAEAEYKTSPLIILNNFAGQDRGQEHKLMTAMLQNMFPAINPSEMQLADARRVVLFNYNDATGMVDFRHYAVKVKPVGVTKGVKRVIMAKNLPSMTNYDDISEYVLREAFASESDVEDGPDNSVTLPQNYVGRGNTKNEQRAVRLVELGPRMELSLMKIEGGLCEGEVLYHSYLHKTKEELEKEARVRQIKLTKQAHRRKEQEQNVERKKKEKEAKKKAAAKKHTKNSDNEEEEGGEESSASSSEDDSGMAEEDSNDDYSEEEDIVSRPGMAADDFGADNYQRSEESSDDDAMDDAESSDEEEKKPQNKRRKRK